MDVHALRERELEELRTLGSAIRDTRAALARLESLRDAKVRHLDTLRIVPRTQIAEVLGVSRGRVWTLLNPEAVVDEDGRVIDVDTDLIEFGQMLFDTAHDEWEAAGFVGRPDDYFPIDAVLRAVR
jgi:hypothetical protein